MRERDVVRVLIGRNVWGEVNTEVMAALRVPISIHSIPNFSVKKTAIRLIKKQRNVKTNYITNYCTFNSNHFTNIYIYKYNG